MSDVRFDGRVVVVTGAGAGLGRTYALLFASRGAKVVVNDLGGGRDGDGKSTRAADGVVDEIVKNGGIAVADYNSVVEGEKIIKTAIDKFGRIDVLINNAGILRDKSFMKLSNQDWELIQAVHLKGSFKTTQAAFPYFKKQNYGRIIMTSSTSGLYGNFGQANYSAAKMGLIGLANTIAIEGERFNTHCNIIVPTAASRLTQDIMPPELFDCLQPELIAPVVAFLCHESCQENGTIIESGGGWAGKCQILRGNGAVLRKNLKDNVSIENVQRLWDNVTDTSNGKCLKSGRDVILALAEVLEGLKNGERKIETQNYVPAQDDTFIFNNRDLIIYALGVGASITRPEEVKFLYENDADFSPLPTFFIQCALQCIMSSSETTEAVPGKNISLEQILHGEQYFELLDEMPLEGKLVSRSKTVEVLDKGSGAVVVSEVETFTGDGKLLARNQIVAFAVGAGNFGGNRTGTKIVPCVPKPSRRPDVTLSQKTSVDQAALYRLSGDLNPLHIDPNVAAIAGHERPILHGLCTLAFSVRLALQAFANFDGRLFKAVKARFTKPTSPGQTLKVDMWQEGNRIFFETTIAETNTAVITGAYVDLKSIIKMPESQSSSSGLKSDAIFEFIIDRVKQDPGKAKSINAVFLYNITKDGKQAKQWTMDLKNAKVYEGTPKEGKPNTTLTVSDEDFLELAAGKLNPQAAFMKGKLKIAGNVMLAQKLTPLLKTEAKL